MPIDSKFYKQKKSKSFYYSVGFLVFVIILTGGLYLYNGIVTSANADLSNNISRLTSSIDTLKEDENIKAYSLYAGNRKTFDSLTVKSQVPTFVKEVKKILSTYSLELDGFSYSAGKITIKVLAESDTSSKAYEKSVKFIRNYRSEDDSLFELENISGVTGQDQLKFDITFIVKD